MRHIKKLILLVFCLLTATILYAHEFTIVYTANTNSELYPCGKCPASVGGGVTRRATVLKKIIKDSKNVVVVDGGNFFPSAADSQGLSDELSKKIVTFYLDAMKRMGYNVVGIGAQDIRFGKEFLEKIIKISSLKFVSSNRLRGVSDYYIHQFPGFKIAFVGLTPQGNDARNINLNNYVRELKKTYKSLRRKADLIVVVSALGGAQNIKLAEAMPEIKLILSSGNNATLRQSTTVANTVIITPTPEGKTLNVVNIDFKNGKIENWGIEKEKMPLSITEDLEIKKAIPTCFTKKDCRKMGTMISRCDSPGTLKSLCMYYDAEPITATIITEEKYPFCSVVLPKQDLKQKLLGLEFVTLDYNAAKAKELVKKYAITTLPAFIFPTTIESSRGFDDVSSLLIKRGDVFLAKPELSGLCLMLDRKPTPNTLDFFFAFDEDNADTVLSDLVKFSEKNKIDLNIYLVTPEKSDLKSSQEEIELALAVKKLYPDKFIDYLIMRFNNRQSLYWLKQMESLGIDSRKVEALIRSKKIKGLINQNNTVIDELNIFSGNVIVVNNNRIFRVFRIDPAGLKRFFDISKK